MSGAGGLGFEGLELRRSSGMTKGLEWGGGGRDNKRVANMSLRASKGLGFRVYSFEQ